MDFLRNSGGARSFCVSSGVGVKGEVWVGRVHAAKSQPGSRVSMLPCWSIMHFSGTTLHAWLELIIVIGTLQTLFSLLFPGCGSCPAIEATIGTACTLHWLLCGAGMGACNHALRRHVLPQHTALLSLSRAWGRLLGALCHLFCSGLACGGAKSQEGAGKVGTGFCFLWSRLFLSPGEMVAWGQWDSWMKPHVSH